MMTGVVVLRFALPALLLLGGLSRAPAKAATSAPRGHDADRLAALYEEAVHELNEEHRRRPRAKDEEELGRELPAGARRALESLLRIEGKESEEALERCARAALDLALVADFRRLRDRLAESDPAAAADLGRVLVHPRFLLLAGPGLGEDWVRDFAAVLDAVLDAYEEVFGFTAWSKIPGKKLRVRAFVPSSPAARPHFAPEHPFHSEIDFPVPGGNAFRSPTPDGKFLLYGICHELGHVIAMWGAPDREDDHHAWAHYTGVTIVESLSRQGLPDRGDTLRDVRWRSLTAERERLDGAPPGLSDRDGVLALLLALHDLAGPDRIGAALNALDDAGRHRRVNAVRYYRLEDLRDALLRDPALRSRRGELSRLFAEAARAAGPR
jgi:hypothetical protein